MMTTGMVSIKDLGNKYQLKDPIEVTIEEDRDGSLVAYWHSVDAVGYGGTLQETVDALKEDVSFLYENLEELPEKCQHLLDKLVIEK